MSDPGELVDLGATLRALRRHGDLSQRELADRAGVPASTVGRIESGASPDPRVRTVERLIVAAGGSVTVRVAPPVTAPVADETDETDEPPVDAAGRRYPAHLDVRRVTEAKDWWGAWWASWYDLPRHRWPRQAPEHTFDLNRDRRDRRRRLSAGRARVARLRVDRLVDPRAPDGARQWTATDRNGAVVGWLAGFVRRRRLGGDHELIICDLEVAPAWRGFGLGRRLVEALRADLAGTEVRRASVLIDETGLPSGFFRACGFHVPPGPQPAWLSVRLPGLSAHRAGRS